MARKALPKGYVCQLQLGVTRSAIDIHNLHADWYLTEHGLHTKPSSNCFASNTKCSTTSAPWVAASIRTTFKSSCISYSGDWLCGTPCSNPCAEGSRRWRSSFTDPSTTRNKTTPKTSCSMDSRCRQQEKVSGQRAWSICSTICWRAN